MRFYSPKAANTMIKRLLGLSVAVSACMSIFAAPPQPPVYYPEILVTGMNTFIPDNATQPLKLDGTYFGKAELGVNSWEHEFEIRNTGHNDLLVTAPITLSGPGASDFAVTQQPQTFLAPGQRSTFRIRYTPTFEGNAYAEINIENNDPDESLFNFTLRGDGVSTPLVGPDLQTEILYYSKYKCKGLPLLWCKMKGAVEFSNLSTSYYLTFASIRIYAVKTDYLTDDSYELDFIPLKKIKPLNPAKPKVKKIKFNGLVPPGYTHIYAEIVPQDGSDDIDYSNNRSEHVYGI